MARKSKEFMKRSRAARLGWKHRRAREAKEHRGARGARGAGGAGGGGGAGGAGGGAEIPEEFGESEDMFYGDESFGEEIEY